MYAICEYANIFGGAACLSTHWPGSFTVDNNPVPNAFLNYMRDNLPNPKHHKIYFDYGDQTLDALYPPLQHNVDIVMRSKGYSKKNWMTQFFPGDNHNLLISFMNNSNTQNDRIRKMLFSSVYPLYLSKVEKKGRSKDELNQVITWLTGYDVKKIEKLINEKTNFETFFKLAKINSNAHLITGVICGYRIEDIKDSLTQQVRYLDKLVDELAKGKKMDKILRNI